MYSDMFCYIHKTNCGEVLLLLQITHWDWPQFCQTSILIVLNLILVFEIQEQRIELIFYLSNNASIHPSIHPSILLYLVHGTTSVSVSVPARSFLVYYLYIFINFCVPISLLPQTALLRNLICTFESMDILVKYCPLFYMSIYYSSQKLFQLFQLSLNNCFQLSFE